MYCFNVSFNFKASKIVQSTQTFLTLATHPKKTSATRRQRKTSATRHQRKTSATRRQSETSSTGKSFKQLMQRMFFVDPYHYGQILPIPSEASHFIVWCFKSLLPMSNI
jgi:hypothetical protein